MQLGRMAWMSPDQFKQEIEAREVSRKTLLVPDLIGEPLQIKIINKEEHVFLNRLVCNPSRHNLFEKAVCGDFIFYFGSEPFNMNHKHAHGILVSYWAKDPKVTKLRLSYNFAVSCLGVFGLGYGSRATVPSIGMNVYNKFYGK